MPLIYSSSLFGEGSLEYFMLNWIWCHGYLDSILILIDYSTLLLDVIVIFWVVPLESYKDYFRYYSRCNAPDKLDQSGEVGVLRNPSMGFDLLFSVASMHVSSPLTLDVILPVNKFTK